MLLLEKCSYLVSPENLKLRNVSSSAAARPLIVRKSQKTNCFFAFPSEPRIRPFQSFGNKELLAGQGTGYIKNSGEKCSYFYLVTGRDERSDLLLWDWSVPSLKNFGMRATI